MPQRNPGAGHSALGLGLLVFVAGASLMCVEIIGGMTIAPYFGSNVFVWGSVIGMFMGALSLGYVLGGKVADRNPKASVLSVLVAVAGVLVALVPTIVPVICCALLETDAGPLFAPLLPFTALVLIYFLPSMLLGMTLPVAVRIGSTALSTVGAVVGKLYALNALGSVAGALVSVFVLAVFFGNRAILLGCGAVLVVVAAVCFWLERGVAVGGAERGVRKAARKPTPVPGLRALVFICGMLLMSLEVVGGAEIAPYFGSNVFVWGSVITVFLGALCIGYRVGGIVADRRPAIVTLTTLVAAAGIAMLLIPLCAPAVCKMFVGALPAGGVGVLGALFASILLYFPPTVLLAMVAPFAVRLSTRRVGSIGGVAGKLYALSTLGNVVGALLTTFVLISAIGKTHLLELSGFVTALVAVATLLNYNRATGARKQPLLVSGLVLLAVAALALWPKPPLVPLAKEGERLLGIVDVAGSGHWHLVEAERWDPAEGEYGDYHLLRRIRAERESAYHHVAVIEEKSLPVGEEIRTIDGTRFNISRTTLSGNRRDLRFDRYVESSVRLDDDARNIRKPYTAGTTYTDLLHLPFIFSDEITDVLIVGGGGGVVPMVFKNSYPRLSIDVVEIDPVVAQVAKEWFGFQPGERVRLHIRDARMFIHNSEKEYDLIILDAYTAGSRIPFHLTTEEFLTEVLDRLRPRGIVLMNVISGVTGPASRLFRAEYKTFGAVFGFDHVYVFPKSPSDLAFSQNVMLIATGPRHTRRLSSDEVEGLAKARTASGKIKMATLPEYASHMFTEQEQKDIRQDDVPVLTDDYAPVDMMVIELEE